MKKKVSGIMSALLLASIFAAVLDVRTTGPICTGAARSMDSLWQPVIEWNKTYGWEGIDKAYALVQKNDGGYAIAGVGRPTGLDPGALLMFTDENGVFQSYQLYGGGHLETPYSLIKTSDGGYALAGETTRFNGNDFYLAKTDGVGFEEWCRGWFGRGVAYSVIGGWKHVVAGTSKSVSGEEDFWLVKTDEYGNTLWSQKYHRTGHDEAHCVVSTDDGGYAIAGSTWEAGQSDGWLIKTDGDRNMLWNRTYGAMGWNQIFSMIKTSDEGFALAGCTNSSGAGGYDFWLVKTDSNGDQLWEKSYGGANDEVAYSMVNTTDGGYLLAGYTKSFGAGGSDVWLLKTDSFGNQEWNKTFGGANDDEATSIIQTSDGGYAVAGYTNSFGAGDYDFLLIKLARLPRTITVPDDYPTIQEAINNANDGDTIYVKSGTYYENVVVNRTVSLVGQSSNNTIIDGNAGFCAVTITAACVNISGFTVQNAVELISLENTHNCVVEDNIARNNIALDSAIHALSSFNCTISKNLVTNDYRGMEYDRCQDFTVSNNKIEHCSDFCIRLAYSQGLTISENNLAVVYLGLQLSISQNNTVKENNITGANWVGIWVEFSSSVGNKIFHNNIIGNARQTLLSATAVWDNDYPSGGNYWSDYDGVDQKSGPYQNQTGSDGIGDISYVIDTNNRDNYPLMKPYVPFENQTIYIRADGSVDPSGAPILRKGDHYTLSGNITSSADGIVIERNNIVLNGAGYTVQGGGIRDYILYGVRLADISNVTIKDTNIKQFYFGVYPYSSSNCIISRNNITANDWGIYLWWSSNNTVSDNYALNNGAGIFVGHYSNNNTVSGNDATLNGEGIYLYHSSANNIFSGNIVTTNSMGVLVDKSSNDTFIGNTLAANEFYAIGLGESSNINVNENNITANGCGINIGLSSGNRIFHNNFLHNTQQTYVLNSTNIWDNGYPSGGNHWSNYNGTDSFSSPYQNITGSDGIGDNPYVIDVNNKDNYPLMNPWAPPDIAVGNVIPSKNIVGQGYSLDINTRVTNQGNKIENFNVTVYANTTVIGKQTIILTGKNSTTINFKWNTKGFAKGSYTLWAYASPVPGEINTANNIFTYGTVKVTIPGDVDGDFHVTILDVVKIASIYASKKGDPNFNPNCDLDGDGKITILDVVTCTSHYGQKWP